MIRTLFYRLKSLIHDTGAEWDSLAPSEETAVEFAHTYINEEPQRMIDHNHYSLEYCLAHSGESINDRFRDDRADKIDMDIADMVATHRTKKPLVVYRGVCDAVYKLMQDNAKGIDGVDLYEKSFLQTSLVKGHESNSNHRLRIYVPTGTQAVYLGNVNYEQNWYEVDIQHGAKLRIVSIDKEYINCIIV